MADDTPDRDDSDPTAVEPPNAGRDDDLGDASDAVPDDDEESYSLSHHFIALPPSIFLILVIWLSFALEERHFYEGALFTDQSQWQDISVLFAAIMGVPPFFYALVGRLSGETPNKPLRRPLGGSAACAAFCLLAFFTTERLDEDGLRQSAFWEPTITHYGWDLLEEVRTACRQDPDDTPVVEYEVVFKGSQPMDLFPSGDDEAESFVPRLSLVYQHLHGRPDLRFTPMRTSSTSMGGGSGDLNVDCKQAIVEWGVPPDHRDFVFRLMTEPPHQVPLPPPPADAPATPRSGP